MSDALAKKGEKATEESLKTGEIATKTAPFAMTKKPKVLANDFIIVVQNDESKKIQGNPINDNSIGAA